MNNKRINDEISLQKLYQILFSVKEEVLRISARLRAIESQIKGVNSDNEKV